MWWTRRSGISLRKILTATSIAVTDYTLTVELVDCGTISVPLDWYPKLVHATPEERNNWELNADVGHIHWEDLYEDISVFFDHFHTTIVGATKNRSEAKCRKQ